jgi:uncharacterized protein YqeY
MTLQEQISKDIVQAMKDKQKDKLEALRYLKALFIQNNTSTKPTDDLSVMVAHVKKLQDSTEMYAAGTEARIKLDNEIAILKTYLPAEMSEGEVVAIINSIKASGKTQMGEIMKELQPQIKGRFDGKRASDLVKAACS